MNDINSGTEAISCYVSVERCQDVTETERAIPAIVEAIREYADTFNVPVPEMPISSPESMLSAVLKSWAALVAPKPLIILFDEVDVMEAPTMISFLRQLRGGFAGRGVGKFPVSIALVGMRDLRDYLVKSKDGSDLNPGSPFNIKHDSATIGNFLQDDIAILTGQHTSETGQKFSKEALDRIWHFTSGQPWLVNALCDKIVYKIAPPDQTKCITVAHVDEAKEQLIKSRTTHIDSLSERLRDKRVRKIIQPIITGEADPTMAVGDDFVYCQDLGLVTVQDGTPGIANAIYREVLAIVLSYGIQLAIPAPEFILENNDGSLNMDNLLKEFQKFWAWYSDIWEEKADYTEAFPHLLLMAFLQRIINGGGQIEREYAAGRGRIDLLVDYSGKHNIIEIKLVHPKMGRNMTLAKGLEQIARYAATTNADTRHLVIFDRRQKYRDKPWDERLGWEVKVAPDNKPVTVVWC